MAGRLIPPNTLSSSTREIPFFVQHSPHSTGMKIAFFFLSTWLDIQVFFFLFSFAFSVIALTAMSRPAWLVFLLVQLSLQDRRHLDDPELHCCTLNSFPFRSFHSACTAWSLVGYTGQLARRFIYAFFPYIEMLLYDKIENGLDLLCPSDSFRSLIPLVYYTDIRWPLAETRLVGVVSILGRLFILRFEVL